MKEPDYSNWDEYRRNMIRETEAYIEWARTHPEETISIPGKPVEMGGYPRRVANWFWHVVLTDKVDSTISFWRQILKRRPDRKLTHWRERL